MSTALISGGNRGIGLAVARALAERGVSVVIGARDLAAGAAAAEHVGHGAAAVQLDVTDPASIRAAVDWMGEHHDSLDILINNAGVLPEASHTGEEIIDLDLFHQTYARTSSDRSRCWRSSYPSFADPAQGGS